MNESEIKSSGYSPPCRKGPMCAILASNHDSDKNACFIAYGGQVSLTAMRNDTWIFCSDFDKNGKGDEWKQLTKTIEAPMKRWKGSMAEVGRNTSNSLPSFALLFGGSDFLNSNTKETFYNDIWKLDLTESEIWSQVEPSSNASDVPTPRRAHSAVDFSTPNSSQMLLFAGKNSKNKVLKDLWLYDIDSSSWTEITDPAFPGKNRKGHSAATLYTEKSNCMIIYGGRFDDFTYFDDLYMFCRKHDTGDSLWREIEFERKGKKGVNFPNARNHQSSDIVHGKFIVIGGRSSYQNAETHEDIWEFDFNGFDDDAFFDGRPPLEVIEWKKMDVKNSNAYVFSSRMEHCSASFEDYVVVFGGQDYLGNRRNDLIAFETETETFHTLEQTDCGMTGAGLEKEGALPLIIGIMVFTIGLCLFWQRFKNSEQRQGYRRIR